jgi:hypothetical protein
MAIIQMLCFCSFDCNRQVSPQSCFCPAPTSEASSQPTKQPSGQPSEQPSGQPSGEPVNPSASPTMRPTNDGATNAPTTTRPTDEPTRVPESSFPTRQPSVLPTSSRPSSVPTVQPSEFPSIKPTSLTTTRMSFTAVSKIDGVNVSTFLGDPAYGAAYIDATAAVTSVSVDAISIIDISNDERRSLKRESMLRVLATDLPILVKTETVIILEDAGLSSSDGKAKFESLSKAFSAAVASGKFGRELDAAALLHGLDTASMDSDISFVPTFGDPYIVEERTVFPTGVPTMRTEKDDGDGGDTVILVIIVVVVVAVLVGGICIYYFLFHRAGEKYNSRRVVPGEEDNKHAGGVLITAEDCVGL